MTVRLQVLSTCGVSVLRGALTETLLRAWANRSDLSPSEHAELRDAVEVTRRRLSDSGAGDAGALSAELGALVKIRERYRTGGMLHYLLVTDTVLGRACGDVLAEHLRSRGEGCIVLDDIAGLRTDDASAFKEALSLVAHRIDTFHDGRSQWMFNLTGGFKSINAYMQTLGMLYGARCVFLFEQANELMEIPVLPVAMVGKDALASHLDVFRRFEADLAVERSQALGVVETLVTDVDGKLMLSDFGELMWRRYRDQLLGSSLLAPLSDRLRYSDPQRLRSDVRALSKERIGSVNSAFDELSAHLESRRPIRAAHTFKSLAGDPRPPATHELYLWNDLDAARAFGHFDGAVFSIDAIGKHL